MQMLLFLASLLVGVWGLVGGGAQVAYADTNDQSFAGVIDTKCPNKCGDLNVPYPFGIITSKGGGLICSRNPQFDITCNHSTHPPKAYIKDWTMQIFNISESQLRVSNFVARSCYNNQSAGPLYENHYAQVDFNESPYTFSSTDNVFTVVGCDDRGSIYQAEDDNLPKGCSTTCHNANEVQGNECLGTGCCQVSVKVRKYFDIYMGTCSCPHGSHGDGRKSGSGCAPDQRSKPRQFNFVIGNNHPHGMTVAYS